MKYTKKQSNSKKYSKKKNILKNIKNKSKKLLPELNQGLQKVGSTVKTAAVKSEPYLKKGIANIYGVLASGFNKGVDKISSLRKNKTQKKRK